MIILIITHNNNHAKHWGIKMPLIKSKSKKAFRSNVKELVNAYKEKGKIGTSKPKSKKAAIRQAIAISYAQKRKSK